MPVELTERDRRIFRHVKRYRLTTRKALQRLFWPTSEEGMKTRVRELTGSYLRAQPLAGREKYYQLTPEAARLLGQPELAEPLGVQACARAYALLAYCCLLDGERIRYGREEFGADFPELLAADTAFEKHDYVLEQDADGARRLARVVIDYGAEASTAVRKCRRILSQATENPALQPHHAEGRFVVVLLTSDPAKRDTLEAALDAEALDHVLPVQVIPTLDVLVHRSRQTGIFDAEA